MAPRPTLLSTLALLALLATLVITLDRAGCTRVVMLEHALKTKLTRADPDYDRLEADRRARPGARAGEPEHGTRPPDADASQPLFPPPYWTGFRGPSGEGVYAERDLITEWPDAGPPRLWSQPVGGGWSSFAVARGLALTIEQRREDEAVVAYDLESGAEVWIDRYPARFFESLGGEGPRATPLVVDAAVVALGATGELRCLDLESGELRWRRDVLGEGDQGNLTYGLCASPIHVPGPPPGDGGGAAAGSVVVLTGAPGSSRLVHAFSLESGEPLWSSLGDRGAYATPVLARLAGREQLLVATASRIVGLDPRDGALLWEFPWSVQGGLMITQPMVVQPDRLLVSAGYGAGALVLELACADGGCEAQVVWRNTRLKAKFNSPVIHGDHVYGLDEGTLVCLELDSGKRRWKAGRFGYGQLLLAGDGILVVSESGELARVRATPEGYEEECRFDAIEGTTWNVPALADGRLLVRNALEMACFDLRPR